VGIRGGPLFRRNIKSEVFFTKCCSAARVSLATSALTGPPVGKVVKQRKFYYQCSASQITQIMVVKCQNSKQFDLVLLT
jgi:hypothetical protein